MLTLENMIAMVTIIVWMIHIAVVEYSLALTVFL